MGRLLLLTLYVLLMRCAAGVVLLVLLLRDGCLTCPTCLPACLLPAELLSSPPEPCSKPCASLLKSPLLLAVNHVGCRGV